MNRQFDPSVFDAMQAGEPLAIYQKTIVGKVNLIVLNPFSGDPTEHLLTGKPGDESSQFRVWSVPEDVFFKQMNRRHFDRGTVIKINAKIEDPIKSDALEQASDEDLHKLVNGKFLALQNALRKTESVALVYRILTIAENEDKSEKLVSAVRTRLAELQSAQYNQEELE